MLKSFLVVVAAVITVPLGSAQSPYMRGDTVRLTDQEKGARFPDSRVVAVPGDRVRIDRSGVAVNGLVVSGVSRELLQTVAETWDQLVPEAHYFVIGESGAATDMVRYYGMIPAKNILGKL